MFHRRDVECEVKVRFLGVRLRRQKASAVGCGLLRSWIGVSMGTVPGSPERALDPIAKLRWIQVAGNGHNHVLGRIEALVELEHLVPSEAAYRPFGADHRAPIGMHLVRGGEEVSRGAPRRQ